jgi:hypothetical protein
MNTPPKANRNGTSKKSKGISKAGVPPAALGSAPKGHHANPGQHDRGDGQFGHGIIGNVVRPAFLKLRIF